MCGIIGYMTASHHGISEERVAGFRRRLALQSHRGPDNCDYRVIGDRLLVGHNRLSIIDPTHANDQPFVTRRSILIFNGEIFNFPDLKNELNSCGVMFRTQGDSEVISAGYAVWGTEIFRKIKGMYAIALYDLQEETLHLARDAFGIKPLYIREHGNELHFASEIKGIDAPVEIDTTGFADLVTFGYHFGSASLYRGIHSVEPGQRYTYTSRSGQLVITRHRDKVLEDIAFRQPPSRDVGDIVRKAVTDHLISDVPLACALSGGLDSSIVTTVAAERNPAIHAYTNTLFPNGDAETHHAAIVSTRLGILQKMIFTGIDDFEATIRSICYFTEEPLVNAAIFNSFFLAKQMRADGFKVALVGEGADELFGGYPWHTLPLIESDPGKAFDRLREWRAVSPAPASFLKAEARALVERREREQKEIFFQETEGPDGSRFNNFLMFDIRHQLLTMQLQRIDRLFMAHGVEARVPFLYDDVLQCAFATAPQARIDLSDRPRLRAEKVCLAEAFSADLPAEIVRRPKFGKDGSVNVGSAPAMKAWPAVTKSVTTEQRYADARERLSGLVDWEAASAPNLPRRQQMFVSLLVLGVDAMLMAANQEWREEALGPLAGPWIEETPRISHDEVARGGRLARSG